MAGWGKHRPLICTPAPYQHTGGHVEPWPPPNRATTATTMMLTAGPAPQTAESGMDPELQSLEWTPNCRVWKRMLRINM